MLPDLDSAPASSDDSGQPASFSNDPGASCEGGIALSLQHIAKLAQGVDRRMTRALREIDEINLQTRLLSFNAQLEASHAGAAGKAFEVVAREMVALSDRTSRAAKTLDAETHADLASLSELIQRAAGAVRGTRLSDLAFTNIDLIDRNLYERSCDVRWWATDSSCVQALLDPASHAAHASKRLGVILDAYTVYYDIVLCDLQGRIIANGRPDHYKCLGADQSETVWFRSAMATATGAEFGFAGLHQSPSLAGGAKVLVYSATVRREGKTDGEPIGCLGIVFNWDALAQTIVTRTQVGEREKLHTRACIVNDHGAIIADNRERHLLDTIDLEPYAALIRSRKGYILADMAGEPHLIAYAYSPGFETYSTGWHSFIFQPVVIP